jgi:hypothetical protein
MGRFSGNLSKRVDKQKDCRVRMEYEKACNFRPDGYTVPLTFEGNPIFIVRKGF